MIKKFKKIRNMENIALVILTLTVASFLFLLIWYYFPRKVEVIKFVEIPIEIEVVKEVVIDNGCMVEENDYTEMEMTITAYCTCPKCCGKWSEEHHSRIGTDYIQKTASGTIPTANRTIAVDTNVIPFGTEVEIDGITYLAEDTGGAIKGNRIDIYMDSHKEALEWGVQSRVVKVYYK